MKVPRRIPRRAALLLWASVVVVLVLVVPMLKFLLFGGLRRAAPVPASTSTTAPVRDLGRAWVATEVARFSYAGRGETLAGVEDASLGVNTRLEVILPTPDGGQLVIDRPAELKGAGRVRRFYASGAFRTRFEVPFGSTLFAVDREGDLWFDLASGAGTVETVVHMDGRGKVLGRYPLPEKLRARFLQISPAGDVYAFVEEWLVDMRQDVATYQPSLVPVALGRRHDPPADAARQRVAGSFFDASGRLYRVSGTTRVKSAEVPTFTAEASDPAGKVVARYALPRGLKPVAAMGDGTLIAASGVGAPSSAPGVSSLGDPVGDLVEVAACTPEGKVDTFRISPPRYVSNWAPPVLLAPDGGLQLTANRGDDVAVLRLGPSAAEGDMASAAAGPPQLSVLFPEEPFSGDPYAASDVAVRDLFGLVYGGLVRLGAGLEPVPDLAAEVPSAANGGVSKDGRMITYRLRAGARWHDGMLVTAKDVVATWRYLRSPHPDDRPRPFPGFELIESVEASGDRVVVRLSKAFGPGPEAFFPYVLPAHLLAEGAPRFLSAPVGTGPFRLLRWETGARWALEAAEGPRKPRLRRMDVLFKTGAEARAVFTTSPDPVLWSWMSAEQVDAARRDRVGELSWAETGRTWALVLNADSPALADPATRRALIAAYPLARLERTVLPSEGATGAARLFARSAGARASTDDTAAAASLLDAAGWARDTRPRTRAGLPLEVTVGVTQRESVDEVTVEELREVVVAWDAIGVEAERELGRARFYGSWWQAGHLSFGDWKTAIGVFPAFPDPGWGGVFDPADTPSRHDPLGLNVSRNDDAQLRRLFERARSEPDREVRARLGTAIAQRVRELGLGLPERPEVRWTGGVGGIRGYDPAPYPAGEFWNVEDWTTPGGGR